MNEPPEKPRRLKPRHQRFVEEYLLDLDAKNAAIRAGYATRSAHANSFRLLRQPDIAAAVEKELASRQEQIRITSDRVALEYARIAFANMKDFMDWGPNGQQLRPKDSLSDADAAAISDIQPTASGGKVKLYDKQAALNALARHLGMFDSKSRIGEKDRTINGRDAREVLRERVMKLVKKDEK